MRFKTFRRVAGAGLGALLLAGSLAASPLPRLAGETVTTSYGWNFQKEASGLLAETRGLTNKLYRDADTLAVLARGNQVSWQTHANYLNSVRSHINELGKRLERLQAIKHVVAPWQQQAIDRMVPVAVELATRTQSAITHLNENQRFYFAESYQQHLDAISDRAVELKETISGFVDFGQTQQKMERLQQQMEIASS